MEDNDPATFITAEPPQTYGTWQDDYENLQWYGSRMYEEPLHKKFPKILPS